MDKMYAPATLTAAWARVRANGGAAGVDGESIERFAAQSEQYLTELATALRSGAYRAQPVKRVEIPKGDGKTRPLGIPVVKDRIVQTAMKLVIEPIFEAIFRPTSYGFRPGRSGHDALGEVDRLIKDGCCFVADADLKGYFDSIPHERLMQRVEERISDGPGLRDWLAQDILQGLERWTPEAGTPQGAVMAPRTQKITLVPTILASAPSAEESGLGRVGKGMQCRTTICSSPTRISLTRSRRMRWRSDTSRVSADARSRVRNVVSVSARRR
jgi:RNA-directed DNA polymerase